MAMPSLTSIAPVRGPTGGGDLVRLTGTNIAAHLTVFFGDAAGQVLSVREESGLWIIDLRTPPHTDGFVDVTVRNLDETGQPIPGEEVVLPQAYRYIRPRIIRESTLTRLVRTLLRELKRQVLANTSITVALDYDDTSADGLDIIALAELPALVLSGPRVAENRFFAQNELHQEIVPGPSGPEIQRRRPPFTVDLQFTLTAASDRTIELLNLMAAVATFLNRNRWVEMARDPDEPAAGTVRWEMDPQGEFRTRLDGPGEVRAFACGFVVRGFDIDEGLPLDLGKAVADAALDTEPIPPGEPS
jgi:hypothetical protein